MSSLECRVQDKIFPNWMEVRAIFGEENLGILWDTSNNSKVHTVYFFIHVL